MGISVAIHPPKTPVTKGSHGMAKATIPNICKMPGPPAPFVPTPLPNIGKSELSPKGYSTTVEIEGNAVAIRGATFESIGDMASKGTGGGLISANCHGPTKFIAPGSMTVKIEGKNVHLLSDSMLNNCGPSGSPPNTGATMMGVDQSEKKVSDPECEEANKEAQKLANEMRNLPKSQRPNKVSVLRVGGRNFYGVNGGKLHELVEKGAKSYPSNQFNCKCAELGAVSASYNQGIIPVGAVIVTVNVRGPNSASGTHGTKEPACSVCNPYLGDMKIKEC
jgi:uncharacterized Zn-binding protein involved in type VI secretion